MIKKKANFGNTEVHFVGLKVYAHGREDGNDGKIHSTNSKMKGMMKGARN